MNGQHVWVIWERTGEARPLPEQPRRSLGDQVCPWSCTLRQRCLVGHRPEPLSPGLLFAFAPVPSQTFFCLFVTPLLWFSFEFFGFLDLIFLYLAIHFYFCSFFLFFPPLLFIVPHFQQRLNKESKITGEET